MKKFLPLLLFALLITISAEAQSKRELKQLAKRQEMIDATTDPKDGSRWFMMGEKLQHIRVKVRSCVVSADNVVTVELLIWNFAEKDDYVTLLGDVFNHAYDSQDRYYGADFYFSIANNKKRTRLEEVLIPAGASLKVIMSFDDWNTDPQIIKELKFGVKSSLIPYKIFEPILCDLKINH